MLRFDISESLSTDSDVFFVERFSGEHRLHRSYTPEIVTSTQLLGALAREEITISCVAPPEPQIVTIDSDYNESTLSYGYKR